eukprot:CAMPEP_0205813630 /NCGR_PEP_ID=MMETSP0205-20121125/18340_1 /ASSEMBLY_ACC=CAM_ASM_000278 /TAXON_ID=36767 /ORGANISM="Euplotes focardii, Strain TN1" /LENGTH=54 /DNA_ID=CAMNT_0053096013 /DNA_START=22 /DNA_END=186 /DNA_ORIENTATION=+
MSIDEIAGYIFSGADQDGNGYIDASELNKHCESIALQLGKSPPSEEETIELLEK